MEKISLHTVLSQYKGFGVGLLTTNECNEPNRLIYMEAQTIFVNTMALLMTKKSAQIDGTDAHIYLGTATGVEFHISHELVAQ